MTTFLLIIAFVAHCFTIFFLIKTVYYLRKAKKFRDERISLLETRHDKRDIMRQGNSHKFDEEKEWMTNNTMIEKCFCCHKDINVSLTYAHNPYSGKDVPVCEDCKRTAVNTFVVKVEQERRRNPD